MALWKKKLRKRKSPPSTANTSTTSPQKQRKLFSPEVKLLAVKALEAGLTPAEVSEIVGAGNSSGTARFYMEFVHYFSAKQHWKRAFFRSDRQGLLFV